MPSAQNQGRAASMQPLGTIKNKKGHHLNTPPLWETSRAQHCQAKRYAWAMKTMQAKKPTLIIIPSDVWMKTNNFGDMNEKGYFIPDYKQAFQNDANLLLVISKINTIMAERGFPLKNLESEIKKIENTSNTMAAFAEAIPETPFEQLLRTLKTDMIIQITYTLMQEGPKKSIVFNLQALDAYNQNQVVGANGTGAPSASVNLPVLLEEAVLSQMDNFTASLQKYFDVLMEKGRESKLFVRVSKKANINLDKDMNIAEEEKRLLDWMDVYFKKKLKRYNIDNQENDYSVDITLNIPLLDEKGVGFSLNDFMSQFRRYLSNSLKIESKYSLKGLGEAWLVIEGEKSI